MKKRMYKINNIDRNIYGYNCDNYLYYNPDGKNIISKLVSGDTDQNYRTFINFPGSYVPEFGKVYYVDHSCWINREIDFFNIRPGYYKFFIH